MEEQRRDRVPREMVPRLVAAPVSWFVGAPIIGPHIVAARPFSLQIPPASRRTQLVLDREVAGAGGGPRKRYGYEGEDFGGAFFPRWRVSEPRLAPPESIYGLLAAHPPPRLPEPLWLGPWREKPALPPPSDAADGPLCPPRSGEARVAWYAQPPPPPPPVLAQPAVARKRKDPRGRLRLRFNCHGPEQFDLERADDDDDDDDGCLVAAKIVRGDPETLRRDDDRRHGSGRRDRLGRASPALRALRDKFASTCLICSRVLHVDDDVVACAGALRACSRTAHALCAFQPKRPPSAYYRGDSPAPERWRCAACLDDDPWAPPGSLAPAPPDLLSTALASPISAAF